MRPSSRAALSCRRRTRSSSIWSFPSSRAAWAFLPKASNSWFRRSKRVDLVMVASGELGAGRQELGAEDEIPALLVSKANKKGTQNGSASPQLPAPNSQLLAPDCLALRLHRIHRHLLPVLVPELEPDHPVNQGEQRIIVGAPNVAAGMELGAAL